MVDERIGGERQDDLRGTQLTKYPGDQGQLDTCESCLIEKKYGSASPRLTALNGSDDCVRLVFEPAVSKNDSFGIGVTALVQGRLEMCSMEGIRVDEIVLEVKMQTL